MPDHGDAAPSGLLTVDEAAAYLRLSPRQLYRMRAELPALAIGRARRYARVALDAWIAAQQAAAVEDAEQWRMDLEELRRRIWYAPRAKAEGRQRPRTHATKGPDDANERRKPRTP